MVQRIYVKCPSCGKIYQLKFQLDESIQIYDWPIRFECVKCGDNLTYKYGRQGLSPKDYKYTPSPKDPPITTIGYSSSLPITIDLYMTDMDYAQSMIFSSPFLNLLIRSPFSLKEIQEYDLFLMRMQKGLLPYKGALNALLPILKNGNVEAFSRKMSTFFNKKQYTPLSSAQKMYDAYFELLKGVYMNIAPQYYLDNYYAKFIKPLEGLIDKLRGGDETRNIKVELDAGGLISKWYKDESLPFLAKSIDNIQRILPAMIFSSTSIKEVATNDNLKIVTIGCDDVMDLYKDGYEVFAHGLKILAGLNNLRQNEKLDAFTNSGLGNVDTIAKFSRLSAGKMIEVLKGDGEFIGYLDGTMNNKIRNAASHGGGINYDATTQHIECYYDATDSSKVYETTLISVCRLCHVLILHLIETTLLARKIVEKAKC